MVRCIFDATTGCLIEYNTQRDPTENEIVAYTDYLKLPENGLIYDFTTGQVRQATAEEASNCYSTIVSPRVRIHLLKLESVTYIRRYKWTKLVWISDSGISDTSGSIHLTPGAWYFVGQLTPIGFSSINMFHIKCTLDGVLFFERYHGGLYYQRYGVSFALQDVLQVDQDKQMEMFIYCNKSIVIDNTDTRTFLRIWESR